MTCDLCGRRIGTRGLLSYSLREGWSLRCEGCPGDFILEVSRFLDSPGEWIERLRGRCWFEERGFETLLEMLLEDAFDIVKEWQANA